MKKLVQKNEKWEQDRAEAITWAKEMLAKDFCILDLETTGLANAEIVEIAIIDRQGTPLVNSLVKPSVDIPRKATAIHSITNQMVKNSPYLPEIWDDVVVTIAGKPLIIYNARFDMKIIAHCCQFYNLVPLKPSATHCLMERYATWYGDWDKRCSSYKWKKLRGSVHRALGDCLAALSCLHQIAFEPEYFE